jgi:acyl-CoA reductase-like NAD-dependent aldehyde dehydrogenase
LTDGPAVIRKRASAVLGASRALRAASTAERAVWLAEAAADLRRSARQAVQELSDATGLSAPMVDWATRTTLDTIDERSLLDLATKACPTSEQAPAPISMLAVVLAGNVFTASARSIFVALLLGAPVLVKASSKELTFPAMTKDALRAASSALGAAMDTVAFRGGDVDCEAALVERAEAVSVYGSDETVAAMASRVGANSLIAHGHGVSVAYCGASAQSESQRSQTIAGLSLDICAYDQRGCLSPQLVFLETSAKQSAEDFAFQLAEQGLARMDRTLPRGPLPTSVGAAQAQWRGVAEVEGTLIRGRSYGIAVRSAESIRWSPGYRNVTVVPVRTIDEAFDAMTPMGASLKCVGADPASISEVRARLGESLALSAYSCPIGSMQTPALDAPADGLPIWHGLLSPQEAAPRHR